MGLLDYFRSTQATKSTADVAKERLQILVAHDRIARNGPSYLPQLRKDLIDVIRKYVNVDLDAVSVKYEQESEHEILELNVVLPESSAKGA